jgi:hypothetical protein
MGQRAWARAEAGADHVADDQAGLAGIRPEVAHGRGVCSALLHLGNPFWLWTLGESSRLHDEHAKSACKHALPYTSGQSRVPAGSILCR